MPATSSNAQVRDIGASSADATGIVARGLTRRFARRLAVADLSLAVSPGEIVALLGPNGAGKSTSLRIISGALPAHAGEVRIAGSNLSTRSAEARGKLGFLAQGSTTVPELTVMECLFHAARLRGRATARAHQDSALALERFHLREFARRPCGQLSTGQRQRVALAMTLIHAPAAVVLDEPSNGLDPAETLALHDLIRSQDHAAVLISTHRLDEVASLCHRALLIESGRLVAELALRPLDPAERWTRVRFATAIHGSVLAQAMGLPEDAADADADGWRLRHREDPDAFAARLATTAASNDWPLVELSPRYEQAAATGALVEAFGYASGAIE